MNDGFMNIVLRVNVWSSLARPPISLNNLHNTNESVTFHQLVK